MSDLRSIPPTKFSSAQVRRWLLAGCVAFSLAVVPLASQAADSITFTPEIPLPGLFDKQDMTVDSSLMANYIKAIYIYFIWVVATVAIVMVIYGGIRWVAAAGNAGQITEARDIIDNAVIGVIIALTSFVLLNIINPKLTQLSLPGLSSVGKKIVDTLPSLSYKDEKGNCLPSEKIPCGLLCSDASGKKVIGACALCVYTAEPEPGTSCGDESKEGTVLASEGNCLYVSCLNKDQACTYNSSSVSPVPLSTYSCTASQSGLNLSSAGYQVSTAKFTLQHECGTMWYEPASAGFLGVGAHDERLLAGTACGATGKHCVVDYGQALKITMSKSSITGTAAVQIGSWPSSATSGCI